MDGVIHPRSGDVVTWSYRPPPSLWQLLSRPRSYFVEGLSNRLCAEKCTNPVDAVPLSTTPAKRGRASQPRPVTEANTGAALITRPSRRNRAHGVPYLFDRFAVDSCFQSAAERPRRCPACGAEVAGELQSALSDGYRVQRVRGFCAGELELREPPDLRHRTRPARTLSDSFCYFERYFETRDRSRRTNPETPGLSLTAVGVMAGSHREEKSRRASRERSPPDRRLQADAGH